MRRVLESDVCIIGAGITAAMVAAKLADEREARVMVVEAGGHPPPVAERYGHRQRWLDYEENPWPDDHVVSQDVEGRPMGYSPSMQVGGLAMHWGAVTPRFSPEDMRVHATYGVGTDWPLDYDELDSFYQEAEERIGVAGAQGPPHLDPRSKPYPMPAIPLTWNLERLQEWVEKTGVPFWAMPSAKNSVPWGGRAVCCRSETCDPICPVGAKYSPDFTFYDLRDRGRIELLTHTLVRRLALAPGSDRVERAVAVDRRRPDQPVELRARTFVLAGGFVWVPHLLLLSASGSYPDGLANRSGLVGRYLAGHRGVNAYVELPMPIYPGMNGQHSLISKHWMKDGPRGRYLRHDFRVWESGYARGPRLLDDQGRVLLGDDVLRDWRGRAATGRGTARLRCYYDVIPGKDSELTLDRGFTNEWGDPLPRVRFADDEVSAGLRPWTEDTLAKLFEDFARAGDGKLLRVAPGDAQEHPGGGCRMGEDPARSVVDKWGRSHDHENLFIVGAPTLPSTSCTNGTLTFAALGLHSAAEVGRDLPALQEAAAPGP
jgi:glucose dehydrogenase